MAASLAYLFARPEEGIVSIAASESHSGLLLRTLLPAIIVVPILIGWLRLVGQRANLYDTEFGIALQVLGSVGCLAALTMLIVRTMHRLEREQGRIQEALRDMGGRLIAAQEEERSRIARELHDDLAQRKENTLAVHPGDTVSDGGVLGPPISAGLRTAHLPKH